MASSVTLNETLDHKRIKDIYDAAWYAYSLLETKNHAALDEAVVVLTRLMGEALYIPSHLPILLYNRRLAVGLLLSYHVMAKTKRLTSDKEKLLPKILDIMENYSSWYNHNGEVLFALYKLSGSISKVLRKTYVTNLAKEAFDALYEKLEKGMITVEDVENISFITCILVEDQVNIEKEKLSSVLSSNSVYRLAKKYTNTLPIYAFALSSFILKSGIRERAILYDKFYGRVQEVHQQLTDFDKVHGNLVKPAIKAKILLAKNLAIRARTLLEQYSMLERAKRRYATVAIASITALYLVSLLEEHVPAFDVFLGKFYLSSFRIKTLIVSSSIIYFLKTAFGKSYLARILKDLLQQLNKIIRGD